LAAKGTVLAPVSGNPGAKEERRIDSEVKGR
jgi:hypothetical protein